jgi:acyl transferase domain-containing protein
MAGDSAGEQLTPLQNAVFLLKRANAKLARYEYAQCEPIAIIGMACRFPGGAVTPDDYWRLLSDGVDAVSEVPPDRWNIDACYDPDPSVPGKMSTRWGGFLDGVYDFDADFFTISPREAVHIDPQQRLLLEVSWEALQNAGVPAGRLAVSSTGVFVGAISSDHRLLQSRDPASVDVFSGTGGSLAILANRLSYLLNVTGPSITIDTACSSSLVTVHMACQSLRRRESNLALAGGVNLILSPETTIALSKAYMMAPDGRCKTFDARANGYVRGEGCGMVLLKRLSDAQADGDRIIAVIRGTAVNHDGRSNGLTAPNGPAQEAVLRAALADARLRPDEIDYVETHGSGTRLGDPIEMDALRAVYCADRPADRHLLVGSVKTNVGHLESAAGIAGLIKSALMLQHGRVTPHLHLQTVNPMLRLDESPIEIPTQGRDWPSGGTPRRAAVSSFGFGGTNAHAILEQAPRQTSRGNSVERPQHLLTLSARSAEALAALAQRYADALAKDGQTSLADIAFTANAGRDHFNYRAAVAGDSHELVRSRLAAIAENTANPGVHIAGTEHDRCPRIAFLFTGQGAQYAGMGRALYDTQPTFRQALDRCARCLQSHLPRPLLSLLEPEAGPLLDQTGNTQPVMFSLQYALAELWRSWGVQPVAVMGHSVGEFAAACVAGVLDLEDALQLIARRAQLMQSLPPGGAMAAVFAAPQEVEAVVQNAAGQVAIAALNGPRNVVISGDSDAVRQCLAELERCGAKGKSLQTSHAFHSHRMDPVLPSLEQAGSAVRYRSPEIDIVANLTGRLADGNTFADPAYWARHARQPIQFAAGMQTLAELDCDAFLEIGPQPILVGMGQRCLPQHQALWLPSLRRGHDDWPTLLHSLAELYVHGQAVDWRGFDRDYARERCELPTYPFQRTRYRLGGVPEIPSADAESSARATPTADRTGASPEGLYELAWVRQPFHTLSPEETSLEPGRWLIFDSRDGIGESLAEHLEIKGHQSQLVTGAISSSSRRSLVRDFLSQWQGACRGIVYLSGLDVGQGSGRSDLAAARDYGWGGVLDLVHGLDEARTAFRPRLWLVTRGAQAIDGYPHAVSLAQSPLWGLGRVIAAERPDLRCVQLDIDPANPAGAIAPLIEEVWSGQRENQLVYRGGERFVARLRRIQSAPAGAFALREDGTYLVTGGLGGLGLKTAQWLAACGARHLVLVGRSGASAQAAPILTELEQAGVRVAVRRCDVAGRDALAALIDDIQADGPPLRGVFHLAGVLDDGVLGEQTRERFDRVMAAKVQGAWNLHALTADCPLEQFVLFSSAAALLGSPGQANYAAGNVFLDALAQQRHREGLPALSINWGSWSGVGMAARLGASQDRRLSAAGVASIEPERGLAMLPSLLATGRPQVGVLPIDWSKFCQRIPPGAEPPWLSEIIAQAPDNGCGSASGPPVLLEKLREVTPGERSETVLTFLQRQAADVLAVEDATQLSPRRPLNELGFDSLTGIEFCKAVGQSVGRRLDPTILFDYSTLARLAQYLLDELEAGRSETPALPAASAVDDPAVDPADDIREQTLDDVQSMSEEEMNALVMQQLTSLRQ